MHMHMHMHIHMQMHMCFQKSNFPDLKLIITCLHGSWVHAWCVRCVSSVAILASAYNFTPLSHTLPYSSLMADTCVVCLDVKPSGISCCSYKHFTCDACIDQLAAHDLSPPALSDKIRCPGMLSCHAASGKRCTDWFDADALSPHVK